MSTKDETLSKAFGELLRDLRARSGLNLAELGAAVYPPMQAQAIARYEAGGRGPTLALLYRLAIALKVNPCDLLPAIEPAEDVPAKPAAKKPTPKKK